MQSIAAAANGVLLIAFSSMQKTNAVILVMMFLLEDAEKSC